MKKRRQGLAKKRLSNAVRSHTRRLRHSEAAEVHTTPDQTAPVRAVQPDVPRDLVDGPDDLRNGPSVMLVITVLAVLFIGLIAWLVAQMPAK